MNENNKYRTVKEFVASVAILLAASLANLILSGSILTLILTVIIGPVILVSFLVRGIRLFRETRSVKLIIVSILIPLLVVPATLFFFFGMDRYSSLNAPSFNPFDQYINIIERKIQTAKLNKLADTAEVNPGEICAIRHFMYDEPVGPKQRAWIYKWAVEWRGTITLPEGDIPGLTNSFPGAILGAQMYIETPSGSYNPIPKTYRFESNFYSDGKPHKWKAISSQTDDMASRMVNVKDAKISFHFGTIDARGKDFYTVNIPETVVQKLINLGASKLEEVYARQLTEAEQHTGGVCVPLK